MKSFTKALILLTLFTFTFSWPAFFDRFGSLKEKEEDIRKNLDLSNATLSHLKNISLKELFHFEAPDIKSKFEKLKNIIPKDLDPSHHKEVAEFWTGIFEYFGLPRPTEVTNCFGKLSGPLFIKKMRTINDLVQHSKAYDEAKLQVDLTHFEVIMHSLEYAQECMAQTKELSDLMESLHITLDSQQLKNAKFLYYQARFDRLADKFQTIVDDMESNNFNRAGRTFAEIFKKGIKDYKKQGEDLLAYQAFGNGVAGALGLPLPSHFVTCYGKEDGKIIMDFFKGFSRAVAEGRWFRADHSAADYWEKEGKALLEKIPGRVWNCDMMSSDTKQLGEKIGVDLNSQEFKDKLTNYINDHNIMFYNHLRTMHAAFAKKDYLHAGSAYAHFLEAVAKSGK